MNKTSRFPKKSLAVAVATSSLLLGQSSIALAQDSVVLEEVIVTANARAQSITDIPYNISAIQGEDIAARQIFTETELLRSVPGVYVVEKGYRNAGIMNMITIRGLNTNTLSNGDMAYNSAPTVSTYINNTPMFANFLLKDIDRVEVLRGPQGTLYGSGNLGGTVRYMMNRPSTEAVEASVDGRYSQTEGSDGDNLGLDLMLNVPLGDQFAVRFAASHIDNDGYTDYDNLYVLNPDGSPAADPCFDGDCSSTSVDDRSQGGAIFTSKEDADTVEVTYARLALMWEPSDSLRFDLAYQTQDDEVGARSGSTPVAADDGTGFGDLVSGRPQLEPSERDVEMTALDIEWDLGFATLTSNTSNYETDGVGVSDNTGFYAKVSWGGAYMTQPRPLNVATRGYKDEGTIQEFRLVSNGSNAIDWTAGMYYADQDYEAYQDSTLPGWVDWADDTMNDSNPDNDFIDGVVDQQFIDDRVGWYGAYSQSALGKNHHAFWQILDTNDFHMVQTNEYEELTFFGEVTFNFAETVHLTLGARAFDNELTAQVLQEVRTYPAGDADTRETQKEDDIIGKVNLAWDMSDQNMIYGTISEGYRRGGANGYPTIGFYGDPGTMFTYDSDKVLNYEVGIKGESDRFRYTLAAFFVEWEDPQINTVAPSSGIYIVQNGQEAETYGIEAEIEGHITEKLYINAGYSYVNAELTDDFFYDLPQDHFANPISTDGNAMPGTPENMFNLSLDYNTNIGEYGMVYRLSGYYQSETENSINNDSELFGVTHDGFSIWDLSATLSMEQWHATLFAKNVTDEEGTTAAFKNEHMGSNASRNLASNNSSHDFVARPRTIGLSLGYRF